MTLGLCSLLFFSVFILETFVCLCISGFVLVASLGSVDPRISASKMCSIWKIRIWPAAGAAGGPPGAAHHGWAAPGKFWLFRELKRNSVIQFCRSGEPHHCSITCLTPAKLHCSLVPGHSGSVWGSASISRSRCMLSLRTKCMRGQCMSATCDMHTRTQGAFTCASCVWQHARDPYPPYWEQGAPATDAPTC